MRRFLEVNIMEGGPNIQVSTEDEETCCDRTYHLCCHPSGKAHRFLALIFMCILGFGKFGLCQLLCLINQLCHHLTATKVHLFFKTTIVLLKI